MEQLLFISQEKKTQSHIHSIEEACKAGVKWIQLRVKDKSEEMVYQMAQQAKAICEEFGARLIINDYPAIAKAVKADGVHLGKEDMPVKVVREIVGKQFMIGATANTFEDIEKHYNDGADYIGLGPYRFTTTKKNLSPILGLKGYQEILNQCRAANMYIPIIAIGGIELDDIENIVQTGVHGVAVSSLIALANDKKQVVSQINKQLKAVFSNYVNHSQ
jgi:thiamine-phosphate pyrophosphorylase